MLDKHLLSQLENLCAFLGQVFGPHCEVVLHDLSDKDTSIVCIENSLTDRKPGGPLTDFALKILKDIEKNNRDFYVNYQGESGTGKPFRSSTLIIRDTDNTPLAMLCINRDITALSRARDLLDSLMGTGNGQPGTSGDPVIEHINSSLEELTENLLERIIKTAPVPPERMTPEEKQEALRKLQDEGFFLLKGSVRETAEAFKISEATVYRYLNKLSKE